MGPASCNDPSHAEILEQLEQLRREVERLRERDEAREAELAERGKELARRDRELGKLQGRVEELESRLAKSSRNSSRPPSSDSPYAARPSRHRPSGRKPGGQPGHAGKTRALVPPEDVKDFVPHGVPACPGCGGTDLEQIGMVRHQVTELPVVRPEVTEHQVLQVRCRSCGTEAVGQLPPDVAQSQFGPRVHAVVAQLTGSFRLTHREVARALEELFGQPVGVGSVTAMQARVAQALEWPYREAQRKLREALAAYIDETSWRERRRKAWLWVAHYGQLVVYHIDLRRSRGAFRRLLAGVFRGVRVVDRTSVHDDVEAAWRQLCLGHTLRDLEGFATGPAGRRLFGRRGKSIVLRAFRAWWRFRDGRIDRARLQEDCEKLRLEMVSLLDDASANHPHARVRRFSKHLRKQVDALFTFARVEGVEPTSNPAERMIRPAVLWRKGSFGTHSKQGSRFVSRFLSVARSLRLQGRDVLEFVVEALAARAGGRSPPSLLPPPAPG